MANMHDEEKGSRCDITARLRSLANGSKGVSHRDFERVLKEMGNVTISELKEVVTFATDQLGFWRVEWLFSPANCPNTLAEAEIDGWRPLLDVCTDELVKRVPNVKDLLENQRELCLLQHIMQLRIDYNETRPLERLFAIVLSKTSIALNKVGFKSIAEMLYSYSLYPKGTVSRASLSSKV
jgi:hypothetical protein